MTPGHQILAHHQLLAAIPVIIPVLVLCLVLLGIVVVDRHRAQKTENNDM